MAEYNLGFSESLIFAASAVLEDGIESEDAQRTVLYLSQLSCELTLKALLERAGMPIVEIIAHSHKLDKLLADLSVRCEVEEGGESRCASAIRSKRICKDDAQLTLGKLMEAEKEGASIYPGQIRYGQSIRNYPPVAWLEAAKILHDYARAYWEKIRMYVTPPSPRSTDLER